MTWLKKQLLEEARKYGWGLILIHRKEFNSFIESLLNKFNKIRLLDIGAWKCMLGDYIKQHFGDKIEYVGVDVIELPDRIKDYEFHVMAGDSLLFPPNSFHAVVFIETLEHIVDYVRALREAYRVLVDGGGIFIQSVICTDHNALLDKTHYHVLHPVTLKRLLEWIGFRNIEYKESGNFAIWGYKV